MASSSDLTSSDESENDRYPDADYDLDSAFMTCSSHSANLLCSLKKLRCNDSFCDVTIKCGNFEMKAHKNILASATDYFKAMFMNQTRELETGFVDFSKMSPEIVKQCIGFIYSGTIDISMKYAKDLLDASEMMQLPELSKLCVDFLAKRLTMETCAEILTLSNLYGKKSLDFPIADFLMRSFEDFHKTEDFKSLNLDSLIYCLNLLQDGSSEHEILKWNGIVTWVDYDVDNRSQELIKLLSVMEWSYLSSKFILDQVCEDPMINESIECLRLLTRIAFDSKTFVDCKGQQTQLTDMLAFSKENKLLFQHNSKTGTWTKIAEYPSRFPECYDVIFHKGILCVGTGRCMRIYSDQKWTTVPSSNEKEMFVETTPSATRSSTATPKLCSAAFAQPSSPTNYFHSSAFGQATRQATRSKRSSPAFSTPTGHTALFNPASVGLPPSSNDDPDDSVYSRLSWLG